MNFASIEKIAAAILYEGYILYPYRPSAIKNRQRWNFGTLYPREYAESQSPAEPFSFQCECVLQANSDATIDLRTRFLQLMRQPRSGAGPDSGGPTDASIEWDEGVERTAEKAGVRVADLVWQPMSLDLCFDADASVQGRMNVSVEKLEDAAGYRLRVVLANLTPLQSGSAATREDGLARSFVSAHLLLGVTGGEFISLFDPPPQFAEAVSRCKNTGVFPVLAGEEGQRTMMLCSPIILYDYPKIAPESAGDFFDGTEMDEMLALRVMTLTDNEKQEMGRSDARARQILQRVESLPEEHLMKVHGAIRGMRPVEKAS